MKKEYQENSKQEKYYIKKEITSKYYTKKEISKKEIEYKKSKYEENSEPKREYQDRKKVCEKNPDSKKENRNWMHKKNKKCLNKAEEFCQQIRQDPYFISTVCHWYLYKNSVILFEHEKYHTAYCSMVAHCFRSKKLINR